MSKHFSYLVDDESEDFFQKVAFQEAGVAPARAAPPEMKKEASFTSDFEKVASRLDRDLGIIKSAGQCGMNGGMVKRASAYLDAVASNSNLSPEEFGEIFEKVAGDAIQTDLDYCFQQICQDLPDAYHEDVALGLAKIGYDAAAEATLIKEAVLAGVGRWLGSMAVKSRVGAGAAKGLGGLAAREGGKAALKGAKGVGYVAGSPLYVGYKAGQLGVKGLRSVGRGIASKAKKLKAGVSSGVRAETKARSAAAAAMKPAGKIEKAIAEGGKKSLKKQRSAIAGADLRKMTKGKVDVPKELAGTTAVGRQSAKSTAAQAEKNMSQITRDKGAKDAAAAAKVPKAPDAPKGAQPNAGAPDAPKMTVKPAPDGIKPPPEVAGNPALMATFNKWTSGGKLTAAEAGKLKGTALKGALGFRVLTGKGAITGGEGVV